MLATILKQAQAQEPPAALLDKLLGLATALRDERALALALAVVAQPNSDTYAQAHSQVLGSGAGVSPAIVGRPAREQTSPERDTYAPWQFAALAGVLDALDRRGQSLKQLQTSAGPELRNTIQKLGALFVEARALATPLSPLPALRLLGRGLTEQEKDLDRLASLLQPQLPTDIQRAALAGLRRASGKHAAQAMLSCWKTSSPALRAEMLNALLTRREWIQEILAAIDQGQIPAGQIGTPEQQKLRTHSDSAIRERATKLFATANADRQKLVEAYRSVAELKGDQARGAALFQQNCAVCHLPQGNRPQVGPDLAALADKSVETLLVAILDPNRAVEARYVNYSAVTKDDREFSGILSAETANSITLRSANGEETILRADLAQLTSSGLSLMPEGFEQVLSPQAMADLIAYLTKK
jgi:putative heme-binding domain-containing protein